MLQSTGQPELAHEGSRAFWASNHVCVHVDAITISIHLFAGVFRDKNSGGVLAFGSPIPHLVSSFNQMSAIINSKKGKKKNPTLKEVSWRGNNFSLCCNWSKNPLFSKSQSLMMDSSVSMVTKTFVATIAYLKQTLIFLWKPHFILDPSVYWPLEKCFTMNHVAMLRSLNVSSHACVRADHFRITHDYAVNCC